MASHSMFSSCRIPVACDGSFLKILLWAIHSLVLKNLCGYMIGGDASRVASNSSDCVASNSSDCDASNSSVSRRVQQ